MGIPYRPLGLVKEALEQIGIEVSYAYEDLVFIQHNHFLLQFGKTGAILFYYANVETAEETAQQFFRAVQAVLGAKGMTLVNRGQYRLTADAGEELSLHFLDQSTASPQDDGA